MASVVKHRGLKPVEDGVMSDMAGYPRAAFAMCKFVERVVEQLVTG